MPVTINITSFATNKHAIFSDFVVGSEIAGNHW
jgi:hypothetical protein